ncbi:MAG TPA: ScyD/ScyE family protein [Natronosporangium sp.]|nr:ScyD/ScyE family protein [Natronosporangium sp.]
MKRTKRLAWLAGAAATALAVTLAPAAPAAADGPQVTVEVVVEGLNVPRGLTYDAALGRVLIAEAGVAAENNGACAAGFGGSRYCYGESGSIYQYSENWWLPSRRIVTGLPSIWAPDIAPIGYEVVLGIHDVALPFGTGSPVAVFGLSGPLSFRDELASHHPKARYLATASLVITGNHIIELADFAEYEENVNPHPAFIDTNPYGVTTDGLDVVVADAAGNFIARRDLFGRVSTLAVIPDYIDETGDNWEGVPMSVTVGPDGAYYIGELSAAFSPAPNARIWRLDRQGNLSLVVEGLYDTSSITFDEQGRMIVLQFANDYYPGGREGKLLRVEQDGSITTLLDGLHTPGGVIHVGNGVFYVTNHSASLGGNGQLLRVTVTG